MTKQPLARTPRTVSWLRSSSPPLPTLTTTVRHLRAKVPLLFTRHFSYYPPSRPNHWYLIICSCTCITQIYVLRVPSGQWLGELLDPLICIPSCAQRMRVRGTLLLQQGRPSPHNFDLPKPHLPFQHPYHCHRRLQHSMG